MTPLLDIRYHRDSRDNLCRLSSQYEKGMSPQREGAPQEDEFSYDERGQVVRHNQDGYSETFSHDATMNVLRSGGYPSRLPEAPGNQVTYSGEYCYRWDGFGRLARRENTRTGVKQRLHYDDAHRLVRVEIQNDHDWREVAFSYDALGRRTCRQLTKNLYFIFSSFLFEEIRLHFSNDISDELFYFSFEWKDLKILCMALSFRSEKDSGKKEPETLVRYYISSEDLTAEKLASAMRSHWDVENELHWRLGVVMNEDDCRIRRGNAAELFFGIRHLAVNILTENKEFKAGLRRKMRRAAMDREYLASVLAGGGRNLVLNIYQNPRKQKTSPKAGFSE